MPTRIQYRLPRRSGDRRAGELWLVSDAHGIICGRMAIGLTAKRCGGNQRKQSKRITRIRPRELVTGSPCSGKCQWECPLSAPRTSAEVARLVWIDERVYPSPQDFLHESEQYGVAVRIPEMPTGFTVGKTWVFLAHVRAVSSLVFGSAPVVQPGVFMAFKPTRLEKVVESEFGEASDDDEFMVRTLDADPQLVMNLGLACS